MALTWHVSRVIGQLGSSSERRARTVQIGMSARRLHETCGFRAAEYQCLPWWPHERCLRLYFWFQPQRAFAFLTLACIDSSHRGGRRAHSRQRVLINLGSRPARPRFPACGSLARGRTKRFCTWRTYKIIGASYIGVEFASMITAFGVDVALVSQRHCCRANETPPASR